MSSHARDKTIEVPGAVPSLSRTVGARGGGGRPGHRRPHGRPRRTPLAPGGRPLRRPRSDRHPAHGHRGPTGGPLERRVELGRRHQRHDHPTVGSHSLETSPTPASNGRPRDEGLREPTRSRTPLSSVRSATESSTQLDSVARDPAASISWSTEGQHLRHHVEADARQARVARHRPDRDRADPHPDVEEPAVPAWKAACTAGISWRPSPPAPRRSGRCSAPGRARGRRPGRPSRPRRPGRAGERAAGSGPPVAHRRALAHTPARHGQAAVGPHPHRGSRPRSPGATSARSIAS